jgi:transcription-repair coupling factor (superfamily II helicase)
MRINLYARLARAHGADAVDAFCEEIEDRFGEAPTEARCLLAAARLRELCRDLGVARVDAGPKAIALTFRDGAAPADPMSGGEPLQWRDGRLILLEPTESTVERLDRVTKLLEGLSDLSRENENGRSASPRKARAGRLGNP